MDHRPFSSQGLKMIVLMWLRYLNLLEFQDLTKDVLTMIGYDPWQAIMLEKFTLSIIINFSGIFVLPETRLI